MFDECLFCWQAVESWLWLWKAVVVVVEAVYFFVLSGVDEYVSYVISSGELKYDIVQ